MLLLNFAHPLTETHLAQIRSVTGQDIERVIAIEAQFDILQPFGGQVQGLIHQIGISVADWQMCVVLVNPPTLHVIAVTLLAELHGRMGYFPAVLRLRPVVDALPPQFEVAEIINLQAVRDAARHSR